MNPLRWKREHQIALLGAAIIGAIVGFIFGIHEADPYGKIFKHFGYYGYTWVDTYWIVVALWSLFGACMVSGAIYVFQLSRA
jgi:hypothetical protein